mmetsp:Transcript_23159/g.41763  ORF Transcript_23159/g.41763 Transcript_23159/m.41763 type:complete len:229 (-) Transcript_23159:707-1393(-)
MVSTLLNVLRMMSMVSTLLNDWKEGRSAESTDLKVSRRMSMSTSAEPPPPASGLSSSSFPPSPSSSLAAVRARRPPASSSTYRGEEDGASFARPLAAISRSNAMRFAASRAGLLSEAPPPKSSLWDRNCCNDAWYSSMVKSSGPPLPPGVLFPRICCMLFIMLFIILSLFALLPPPRPSPLLLPPMPLFMLLLLPTFPYAPYPGEEDDNGSGIIPPMLLLLLPPFVPP